jgi:DNA-binding LacI/PurR family transcriptional regulator
VGFDDTLLARTSRLATVRQPLQQLGLQAAEILLSRIEARKGSASHRAPTNIVLPTELVMGATLAAPRKARLAIA